MLDKSIPYEDILMRRPAGRRIPRATAVPGYRFVPFADGDEYAWADIVTSVGEFESAEDARRYFENDLLKAAGEIHRRCLFGVSDNGQKVATSTAWWALTKSRRDPWLYWVAVRPEYQGIGLGKAIVAACMQRIIELEGDVDIFLHTQTWSYKAINIYRSFGFDITQQRGLGGYSNRHTRRAMSLIRNHLR